MQALYRQYRPKKFSDVVGQDHVVKTLQNQIKRGSVAHAYVFVGTRGVGKTSIARLFASAVNCTEAQTAGELCGTCQNCQQIEQGQFPDIIEIDAASHTGVDNVRTAIVEAVRFAPMQGAKKVFIIDEVHMLSSSAFNALLKTLEEPPAHALFILATTEYRKVPETVSSRCQRFFFHNISQPLIAATLQSITEKEGRKITDEAVNAVARIANGSLRDGERTLEQVFGVTDGELTIEHVQQIVPVPSVDIVMSLVASAFKGEVDAMEKVLQEATNGGVSMRLLQEELIECVRVALLAKQGGKQIPDMWKEHAEWGAVLQVVDIPRAMRLLRALTEYNVRALDIGVPYLGIQIALFSIMDSGVVDVSVAPVALTPAPSAPAQEKTEPKLPRAVPSGAPQAQPEPRNNSNAESQSSGSYADPAPETQTEEPKKPIVPASPLDAGTVVEDLRNKWKRCCEIVGKQSFSLTWVLNSANPISIEGNVITIAFERQFHFETMSQPKNLKILIEAVCEVLQREVDLRPVFQERSDEKKAKDIANMFGGAILEDGLNA